MYICVVPFPAYAHWQAQALKIFQQKHTQYGESWAVLSLPSLIDLMLIKARRIQTLMQQGGHPATGEPPLYDWLALANYAGLALLRLRQVHGPMEEALPEVFQEAASLLEKKNADYGEAWRDMRPLAFIEFILMKLVRLRSLDSDPERNRQAMADNFLDIINYAFLYLSLYGDTAFTA